MGSCIFFFIPQSPRRHPCVLEYLPYRKSDYTSARDHLRHPWTASHGFVVCRADLRGTGDSAGVYRDEYDEQELRDGCEIIGTFLRGEGGGGRFFFFIY